jgi:2-keto-4-pentenoate hydratase/2-oxohepta-3-ene-1,7-dioic acid hydratase in catechol pathway
MKPWSTLAYDPTTVALASLNFHRIDFELELGVYISKGGKNIPK